MENDDENEIEITVEQFKQKVEFILVRLANFLVSQKMSINQLFNSHIYHHEISKTENYEAIPLKVFITILSSIKIKMDMTDIYCVYTKLKYSDDFETIDLKKLIAEMNILRSSQLNDDEDTLDDEDLICSRLVLIMKQKGIGFYDIFKPILTKIKVKYNEGKELKTIDLPDFLKFISEYLLITKSQLSKKCLDLIKLDSTSNPVKVNLENLKSLCIEFEQKIANLKGLDNDVDNIYNDFEDDNIPGKKQMDNSKLIF